MTAMVNHRQMPTPALKDLYLWQLLSPTLPVGAYNYSEGLEWLIDQAVVSNGPELQQWLTQELTQGSIQVETAVMVRAYQAVGKLDDGLPTVDAEKINYWQQWLTATRETRELREQSSQMGNALRKLLLDLHPPIARLWEPLAGEQACHYAIAFGVGAAYLGIDLQSAGRGYLHSWANNLISAGVRLIPLGQTEGQRILTNLGATIYQQGEAILGLPDDELYSCSWGLTMASMAHETQYTRLFRS